MVRVYYSGVSRHDSAVAQLSNCDDRSSTADICRYIYMIIVNIASDNYLISTEINKCH